MFLATTYTSHTYFKELDNSETKIDMKKTFSILQYDENFVFTVMILILFRNHFER